MDGPFPLPLSEQQSVVLFEAMVEAHVATMHRIEQTRPDCEQLAMMAQMHGEVLFLKKIGWLDPAFADDMQDALDLNTGALLGMTPEARQKLALPQEPTGITIATADRQARPFGDIKGKAYVPPPPPNADYWVEPVDTFFNCAPNVADIGAQTRSRARWDAGPGRYQDLTPMAEWITSSDAYPGLVDKIISVDRLASFGRYLALSDIGQGSVALGTGAVLIGVSTAPAWATVAGAFMVGGGVARLGQGLYRIGLDATAEDSAVQQAVAGAAGTVGGVGAAATGTLITQLLTMLRVPDSVVQQAAVGLAHAGGYGMSLELARAQAARRHGGAIARTAASIVYSIPGLEAALASATAAASAVGATVFGSGLLWYFTADYSQRFVPARQAYYLAENDANAVNEFLRRQGALITSMEEDIRDIRQRAPNNVATFGPPGGGYKREVTKLKQTLRGLKGRREAIQENRSDLELACVRVGALVGELLQLEANVANIKEGLGRVFQRVMNGAGAAIAVDKSLAAAVPDRRMRYTPSVVDAVFDGLFRVKLE